MLGFTYTQRILKQLSVHSPYKKVAGYYVEAYIAKHKT